jgi:diaminopimelate epimerase
MALRFSKMHGLGNDYVYVPTFDQTVGDAPALARRMSDRHRGIGSDGLILIARPTRPDADVRMEMYNADGSRAQMCGNGIRCVARYAYERELARRNPMRVETDSGVLSLHLTIGSGGGVEQVRVDMGRPRLGAEQIPTTLAPGAARVVREPLALADRQMQVTCVSMGNPHAVFFVDDTGRIPLREWGPLVEAHAAFPQRINAHWVQALNPRRLRMITWERGAGPTQACGTGACAVCVAAVLNEVGSRDVTVELPGGELHICWDETDEHVYMTGPAEHVFDGVWPE